ncbi:MAG: HNH endonuclease signature motif containing protein [Polyangiaceae bacterium]
MTKIRPVVATALALLLVACTGATPSAPPPATPPAPIPAPAPTASSASAPSTSPSPLPAAIIAEPNGEAGPYSPPSRTRESGCTVRGSLPDPACTPGAVMPTDMNVVCQRSTRERRRVSAEVHRQAFREYGISYPQPRGAYEVDHLIPLELGGDNTIANLWPESAEPTPGFHQKDKVENFLHRQVCSGTMSLTEAQRQIANDWIVVWRRIEGQAAVKDGGEDRGDGD